jgi:hypothetical protein
MAIEDCERIAKHDYENTLPMSREERVLDWALYRPIRIA